MNQQIILVAVVIDGLKQTSLFDQKEHMQPHAHYLAITEEWNLINYWKCITGSCLSHYTEITDILYTP